MNFKRKIARVKVGYHRHQVKKESAALKKLKLQRNRDLREAERLTKSFAAKQQAIEARETKNKARAPIMAARKARNVKIQKEAKGALNELGKIFKSISDYANKPTKKK
jgi:hypothetical protein